MSKLVDDSTSEQFNDIHIDESLVDQHGQVSLFDDNNWIEFCEEAPDFSIYSPEEIVEDAIIHYRQEYGTSGFPYRDLPVYICKQEINKLSAMDGLKGTLTGYNVADTFHPHRFHASADSKRTPFQSFHSDKYLRMALQKTIRYGTGELPKGLPPLVNLVAGTQACSNFRPGFACYMYRKFCNQGDVVLDSSTGYGGRLVGFMASKLGGLYIGVDPNKETHEANLKMAKTLGFESAVELYNLPAEDVEVNGVRNRCDFAFTSPPYFTKEHYAEDDTQSWVRYQTGEAWKEGFLKKMIELQYEALKPGKFNAINIADVTVGNQVYPLEQWTVELAQEIGFQYVSKEFYGLSYFGAARKDRVKRTGDGESNRPAEPVFIFRKGQ